jgi:hypothetical protein
MAIQYIPLAGALAYIVHVEPTLKLALYGMPMGRFAKTARSLFAVPDLNAKLCDISCIARKRFWFAVAPMMYAARKNVHDIGCVFRRL